MVLTNNPTNMDKIKKILEEGILGIPKPEQATLNQILTELKLLREENNSLHETLRKIAFIISDMYQDNKLDRDTKNKLDNFLREYYENPFGSTEQFLNKTIVLLYKFCNFAKNGLVWHSYT